MTREEAIAILDWLCNTNKCRRFLLNGRKERAMTDKAKVCDKAESEYLDKTFPHEEKGTWYDITEMLTSCDVNDNCEECPKYGDDCDGDKR